MKPTPLFGMLAGLACAALTLDAAPGKERARNEFYLYDRATLEHEQPELKGYILDNYMGTILTRLTPEERLALRDVQRYRAASYELAEQRATNRAQSEAAWEALARLEREALSQDATEGIES